RRTKEEMPADPEEVAAAAAEGVQFVFNVTPRELKGEQGRLVEAILNRSHTSGEKLIIDRDTELRIYCKTLIFAVGQERDWSVFGTLHREIRLCAGGDLISGPAAVPQAIQAGRIAAEALAAQLEGKPGPDPSPPESGAVTFEELHLAAWPGLAARGRQEDPSAEAERCLGCGTCNSCGICYLFCPDVAVTPDQGRYLFDLNFCKGCGICARECPARALMMEGGW
ncbi:MAG TPA: 4Fe-4S binding protein, partial [Bacillota bacterium]|nr:4Fe-4S binding protein [Bacillota bacterium]